VAFHWMPAMFGGRQAARTVHFILAFGFVSFTFGHVFMVLTTGVFNNMRSMVTGWYREKVPSRVEIKSEAPPIAPPPAPAPTLALEGDGKGEGERETEQKPEPQTAVPELKADPESKPKDEGDANEKPKS